MDTVQLHEIAKEWFFSQIKDKKAGDVWPTMTVMLTHFAEHLLKQCNVMRSLPSLPSDKDINEKAKTHQQQFPNNSPMRSYKTGYHHALHDIEKA